MAVLAAIGGGAVEIAGGIRDQGAARDAAIGEVVEGKQRCFVPGGLGGA
jgi:hypothetical protein